MSNTQVGNVYQQIIADVVDSSRVDFEEGGVDEHVLEELKKGWQQKLSQLQVATFPWDPKPEQPPPMVNPPTVPSNAGNYQNMGAQPMNPPMNPPMNAPMNQPMNQPMPQMQPMNNANDGPRIKSEPGMENQGLSMPQPPYHNPLMAMTNVTAAQQRAASLLQANYGPRAAASIESIRGNAPPQQPQQGMGQNMHPQQAQQQMQQQQMQQQQMQQQQRPANSMSPQQQQQQLPQQHTPQSQEAYRQAMRAQAQQQQQRLMQNNPAGQPGQNGQYAQNGQGGQPPQGGVAGAQTDGAGDDGDSIGVIKQFDSQGNEIAMGRIEIDNLIRGKIESMGKAMEGGGLMLPLKEATKSKSRPRKNLSGSVPQTDGPGSDDDDDKVKDDPDEDAINSDLDDPDDGLNDDEDDDEGMGHIMLCMYDKVQRVKNKWKCVMKDGVLTVNGKEYVFHKASGEYEW